MTPQRDAMIRAKAARALAWAEAELARTEPMAEFPEQLDHSVHRDDWREQMDAHFERRRQWQDRPEIGALREYRGQMYHLAAYCRYRRQHPVARLLHRSRSIGRIGRGEYGEPTARFSWHWQNLDEDRPAPSRSPSIGTLGLPSLSHEGRAWFDWYVNPAKSLKPLKIELDWAFGRRVWSSGISYSRKNSGTITLHAAVRPLFSVYLILTHLWPRQEDQPSRTYSLSIVGEIGLSTHFLTTVGSALGVGRNESGVRITFNGISRPVVVERHARFDRSAIDPPYVLIMPLSLTPRLREQKAQVAS